MPFTVDVHDTAPPAFLLGAGRPVYKRSQFLDATSINSTTSTSTAPAYHQQHPQQRQIQKTPAVTSFSLRPLEQRIMASTRSPSPQREDSANTSDLSSSHVPHKIPRRQERQPQQEMVQRGGAAASFAAVASLAAPSPASPGSSTTLSDHERPDDCTTRKPGWSSVISIVVKLTSPEIQTGETSDDIVTGPAHVDDNAPAQSENDIVDAHPSANAGLQQPRHYARSRSNRIKCIRARSSTGSQTEYMVRWHRSIIQLSQLGRIVKRRWPMRTVHPIWKHGAQQSAEIEWEMTWEHESRLLSAEESIQKFEEASRNGKTEWVLRNGMWEEHLIED